MRPNVDSNILRGAELVSRYSVSIETSRDSVDEERRKYLQRIQFKRCEDYTERNKIKASTQVSLLLRDSKLENAPDAVINRHSHLREHGTVNEMSLSLS